MVKGIKLRTAADMGMCSSCKTRPPVKGGKTCERCRKHQRTLREKRRSNGLCCCGRMPVEGGKDCELCRAKTREYNRRLRDEVYNAYGGYKCVCCGETEPKFLQLDHINNDGAKHRKEIGRTNIYYWLKQHGFPPGFQVLCANCNYAKAHHGRCPHQDGKEAKRACRKQRK